jgi:hypothetical protein
VLKSILCICILFAVSASAAAQETSKRNWIKLQLPRLGILINKTQMKNIRENIRIVSEYSCETNTHKLPSNTGGTLYGYSIGIGIVLADKVELAYDIVYRESYSGGRTTWSEIGFPSDDYIGYRYNGKDKNLSAVVRFSLEDVPKVFAYFKTGIRFHDNKISSGADAFGKFHTQNSMDINNRSYLFGVGFKVSVDIIEWSLEFEYSNSFSKTSLVRSYGLSFALYSIFYHYKNL